MTTEYIVNPIFPIHEVHLVGGPSGVGKTTWLLQQLAEIIAGRPVLDFPAAPTEWTYVSCDRSPAGMQRTLDRIALPFERSRFFSRRSIPGFHNLPEISDIIQWCPTPLLVIEAIMLLLPATQGRGGSHTYQQVGSWLAYVCDLCVRHSKTVIGTVHSPKCREGEHYPDMRQRVLGSVAFAALVETIILIERADSEELANQHRLVHLLPRNAPEATFYYKLDRRGTFVLTDHPSEETAQWVVEQVFEAMVSGQEFDTLGFTSRCEAKGISSRTVRRWLTEALQSRRIVKVSHGRYCKVQSS